MTAKRFEIIENSKNYLRVDDKTKRMFYLNEKEVVTLLNKQHETITQLQEALVELKEIGDYQADRIKELHEFEDTVFNSLDGKIKRGEKAIEWGERIGADIGSMVFHIEMLKKLKKELEE